MSVADRLRAIWVESLRVEGVRDTDNFAELGGDSIAATLCVTQVASEFDIEVPLTVLLLEDADFLAFVSEVERLIASAPALNE